MPFNTSQWLNICVGTENCIIIQDMEPKALVMLSTTGPDVFLTCLLCLLPKCTQDGHFLRNQRRYLKYLIVFYGCNVYETSECESMSVTFHVCSWCSRFISYVVEARRLLQCKRLYWLVNVS